MLLGEDQPAASVSELKPVLETPPAPKPPARSVPRETVVPEAPKVPKGEEPSQGYELTLVNQDHLGDFLEEAREIVEQLNNNLLTLEKNPESGGDIVNDIFRFFHNLKGNSGIIGYKELNGLTHEAETLLNKVRKQEIPVSHSLVDLLLDVVDSMDELLACIQEDGRVVPVDVSHTTDRVRHLLKTGEIKNAQPDSPSMQKQAASVQTQEGEQSQDLEVDPEDVQIFSQTVAQQLSNINFALKSLEDDSGQPQIVDGLYRSLISIQNASGYMGLDEIRGYVERVAGLVDQGRSSDIDFGLMIDILRQERDIVWDMINGEVIALGGDSLKELVAASWGNGQAAEDDSAQEEGDGSGESDESVTAQPRETLPEPEPVVEKKTSARETETSAGRSAAASPPSPSSSPAAAVAVTPASQPATDASPGNGSKTGQRAKLPSTIRVDHTKLDHLMNLIGELIINRNRFAMLARGLEEGQDVNEIAQKLSETTYSVGRISDDLQDTIMNVRMVPVQSVFSRFPRLVRDLSQKSGKQVELITEGEDTELDKSVVEEIGDPLVHLIRNAVDHGIETAEERAKTGKPDKARVWLRAFHKGNSVGIEVEDDGKGIDPKKMRTQAIRKGVITEEEARTMDDRASIELMFAPGFSTADKITDISGRGVGMDVVRNNIKNLKGSIAVQSVVGRGTRITLTLPLTLAIIDALMIRVDDATYALPLDAVSETTKIETTKLREVNGQKAVTLRGEVLGLVELAELLGLPRHDGTRELLPTVVLTVNDRRLGLIVDTLLERQDVVIKSLGDYLGDLPGISGATIMGDGSVVLILDPHEIYRMATSRAGI
jgi:two-component system chemotaxis sensor kinase CheA